VTSSPAYLSPLFGLAMLAVAAYAAVLLVVSAAPGRAAGRDVDVAHLTMGVAMAGMFVPAWAVGPAAGWEVVFSALLAWFVVRSVRSVQRYGLHIGHAVIHAVMSLAMLLMFRYPLEPGRRGTPPMSMAGVAGGARIDPGLGLVLAVVLLASAVFTLASPTRGASHHGSHHRPVDQGAGGATPELPSGPVTADRAAGRLAAPGLEDASHVVMCVAMGLMLVLML